MAHSAKKNCCSDPRSGKTLEVAIIGKFVSIFETTLDQESEDQLGTFGKITLDKKSHATVPLKESFGITSDPC